MKCWATNYDKCIECGRTDRKHVSHGLCHTCNTRKWRLENPEAYKKLLKKYWATEKYKSYRKEYSKTYQQQNKEKLKNYMREWRKNKNLYAKQNAKQKKKSDDFSFLVHVVEKHK